MAATLRLFVCILLVGASVAWMISKREQITAMTGEPASQAAGPQTGVNPLQEALTEALTEALNEAAPAPVRQQAVEDESDNLTLYQPNQYAVPSDDEQDFNQPTRGLTLRAKRDGHFYLEVQVNGARIPFLVDTGASSVMLTKEAAQRARISPKRSDYTMRARTANGTVRMAPVTLRDMRIGHFRTTNVEGAVNEASMGISLLGMSFLKRLRRYEVKGDELVLYW